MRRKYEQYNIDWNLPINAVKDGNSIIRTARKFGVSKDALSYHLRVTGNRKKDRRRTDEIKFMKEVPEENVDEPSDKTEYTVAYILGRFQAEIEGFCGGTGLSPTTIAKRVGKLLLRSADWTVLGTRNSLP